MVSTVESVSKVSFGLYEADLHTGELWKAGHRVKLQSQPFKVLTALLERPGDVLTREELQERLWGKDAVGDFDHSLGTAINKIRDALGDTAENPRFVETLARRGYRFIAPVTVLDSRPGMAHASGEPNGVETGGHPSENLAATTAQSIPHDRVKAIPSPRSTLWTTIKLVGAMLCLSLAAALGYFLASSRTAPSLPRIERLTWSGRMTPGMQSMESLPASVTDGLRIFIPVLAGGRSVLSQVDVHTGAAQPLEMPSEIASPTLGDISPDGTRLLLRSHLSPESEQPLWTVPVSGGSALRLSNIVAHDATWMPDGDSVLYAAGNQLIVGGLHTGSSTLFATLPGRAFWLRWSPDNTLLRFTLIDPLTHRMSLWEIQANGKNLRELLSSWDAASDKCCGIWMADGRSFVFQVNSTSGSDLWRLIGARSSTPSRVTSGPLNFAAPAAARSGNRLYFLGLDTQSMLEQFDSRRKAFVPAPEFLAQAQRVEYSPDHQWVIWSDVPGRLWRARSDGSELVQVTPDSMQVFIAHWSPDGRTLALMARDHGEAWQIYTIAPTGGNPHRLLPEARNQADPSWSSDGHSLVFGRVTDIMGKESAPRALEVLDLNTGAVTTLAGSEGLFSPRWSPNGKYIVALSLDQRKLLLYDVASRQWKPLSNNTAADPVWSSDSKSLFFHASQADGQPLYRVSIPDGNVEQVASLASFPNGVTADYFFCGLTENDLPIVRARERTGDIYSLDLMSL